MLIDIKENTEFDPGWDERGGLFIARHKVSLIIACHNQLLGDTFVQEVITNAISPIVCLYIIC